MVKGVLKVNQAVATGSRVTTLGVGRSSVQRTKTEMSETGRGLHSGAPWFEAQAAPSPVSGVHRGPLAPPPMARYSRF